MGGGHASYGRTVLWYRGKPARGEVYRLRETTHLRFSVLVYPKR